MAAFIATYQMPFGTGTPTTFTRPASARSLKSFGGSNVDTSASPRSISARRVDGEGMSRVMTRRSFGRAPHQSSFRV